MLNTSEGRTSRFLDNTSPRIPAKPPILKQQRASNRRTSKLLNQNKGFKFFKFNLLKNKVQRENMIPKTITSNLKSMKLQGTQAKQQSQSLRILRSSRPVLRIKVRQKRKPKEECLNAWETTC